MFVDFVRFFTPPPGCCRPSTMRWRLSGGCLSPPASVALLLAVLPVLVAPQQRQEQPILNSSPQSQSHHYGRPSGSVSAPILPPTTDPPSEAINVKKSTDASALATLALAGSGRAVRAPPAHVSSSPSAGLAPPLHARSLQDWEVEDFVLLATVDGTIHARDRLSGTARWALEVPSSPVVESTYHRANRSSFDSTQPEDDFIWIVEPSQHGSIYIYSPGPDAGLQKLGLTVKELVDETPYSGTDPAVTYTARKETTLYTIDARTGHVLRAFSSRGPMPTGHECRKVTADGEVTDACESTSGTLVLGRVEYAVAIQNTETGDPICTLKYSEWTPNNRDIDLQSQYFRTMDQSHIYSMHDGVVLGFDHSRMERPRYSQRFPSPVVRVFDVVRSSATSDAPDAPASLVLLAQPLQPPDPDYGSMEEDRDARVFVDCTDSGGWYALSEETYPLVTGRARMAQCYEKDFFRHGQPLMSLGPHQQRDALTGVHSLNGPRIIHRDMSRIGGSGSPDLASSHDLPHDLIRTPSELALPPALRHSTIIRKGWDNALDIFVTLLLLFLGTWIYLNSHHIQELAKQKLDLKNIMANSGQPPLATGGAGAGGAGGASTTAPLVHDMNQEPPAASPVRPVPNVTVDLDASGDPVRARSVTPTPRRDRRASTPGTPPGPGTPPLLGPNDTPRVRIREPSRGPDDDDVEDLNIQDGDDKPKKKARRGKRGGKSHRRGKKPGEGDSKDQNDPVLGNLQTLQPVPPEAPLTRSGSNEVIEMEGVVQIGRLKVFTDVVLGHGSHGTVVYRGSFDGRDVAVKRMLMEFYDIASHEVGLLQESDDHGNVIRYYCREQAAGFLYIALELCPASLQGLVERPRDCPALVETGLDKPEMLRQIIGGVRYLHSLKIVHRDLKPQNILVAMPRGRAGARSLRLLISDFGLCKKLDDNQSSFRATTAHAAGTSGWRAPELLIDDEKGPGAPPDPPSQHTESSEPAVVDPQTNRRATRAIDIFSLGCVFYYILTNGGHPFDGNGKFMREANIVKGNCDLAELQILGDYASEADDLIRSMLSLDPRRR